MEKDISGGINLGETCPREKSMNFRFAPLDYFGDDEASST
jgi:hypothetical protein